MVTNTFLLYNVGKLDVSFFTIIIISYNSQHLPKEHGISTIDTIWQILTYTRDSVSQALLEDNMEFAQWLENMNEKSQ